MTLKEQPGKWREKPGVIEKLFVIKSSSGLCDSVPWISFFFLNFWLKTSQCASWHLGSSGQKQTFWQIQERCLLQHFRLETTMFLYNLLFYKFSYCWYWNTLSILNKLTVIFLLVLQSLEKMEGDWAPPCAVCPVILLWILAGPEWSQELDSIIHMDPFQLGVLYDSVILSPSWDTELRVNVRYVCAHGGVQMYAYTSTQDDIKAGIWIRCLMLYNGFYRKLSLLVIKPSNLAKEQQLVGSITSPKLYFVIQNWNNVLSQIRVFCEALYFLSSVLLGRLDVAMPDERIWEIPQIDNCSLMICR